MEKLANLVERHPGTPYACQARMDLAIYSANKVSRGTRGLEQNMARYREALQYILPVIESTDFFGCRDHAIDIARICYEKLGETNKAVAMAEQLVREFPDSEFAQKIKNM